MMLETSKNFESDLNFTSNFKVKVQNIVKIDLNLVFFTNQEPE